MATMPARTGGGNRFRDGFMAAGIGVVRESGAWPRMVLNCPAYPEERKAESFMLTSV